MPAPKNLNKNTVSVVNDEKTNKAKVTVSPIKTDAQKAYEQQVRNAAAATAANEMAAKLGTTTYSTTQTNEQKRAINQAAQNAAMTTQAQLNLQPVQAAYEALTKVNGTTPSKNTGINTSLYNGVAKTNGSLNTTDSGRTQMTVTVPATKPESENKTYNTSLIDSVPAGTPTIAAEPVQSNQPSNVVSYMPSTTSSSSYQIQEREKPTYTASTQQTAVQQPTYQKSDYVPTRVTASTAKFEPSQQYLDAMATVQSSLDKLMSGRTSYTDKINSSLKSIEDTAPFSYDFNSDPMFQQMLAGAMKSGKLAMEDSMGQAAALTGGYGSSYSGMVGQQAYNRYIDEAYDRIPDYWGMALSEYQQDLNNKYNLLNQYRASDDTEWNRNFDTFKSQYQMASDQWDRESNTYWNEQNFKENSRQWAESENDNRNRFAEAIRQYENDRAYQQYRDAVSDQQYQQAFDYNKYRDEMSDYYNDRNFDYQLNRDAISDARYDDQTAYERAIDERNFNYNAGQDQIANNLKWANYTLSKDNAKDERDYKNAVLQWEKDQAKAKAEEDVSKQSEEASKLKDPTSKQFEEAWNAYKEGGVEGLNAYYMTLPGVNLVQLEQYVDQMNDNQYVNRQYSSDGDLGVKNNVTGKTDRLNSNMVVYDQNNNKYTLGELAQLIANQEGISVTQAKDIIREMDITNNQATLNDFLRLASNIASNKAKSLK